MAQPTASLIQRSNVSQVSPMAALAKYGGSGKNEPLSTYELGSTLLHQLSFILVNGQRVVHERSLIRRVLQLQLAFLKRMRSSMLKVDLSPTASRAARCVLESRAGLVTRSLGSDSLAFKPKSRLVGSVASRTRVLTSKLARLAKRLVKRGTSLKKLKFKRKNPIKPWLRPKVKLSSSKTNSKTTENTKLKPDVSKSQISLKQVKQTKPTKPYKLPEPQALTPRSKPIKRDQAKSPRAKLAIETKELPPKINIAKDAQAHSNQFKQNKSTKKYTPRPAAQPKSSNSTPTRPAQPKSSNSTPTRPAQYSPIKDSQNSSSQSKPTKPTQANKTKKPKNTL